MCSHTRLFVGNLPENTKENDLQSAFSSFGEIINLDLKCKPAEESNKKNFAFVTLSASNYDVESCIKHFSNENFYGNTIYVTRARESFLERLQRERDQSQKKETEKIPHTSKNNPVLNLGNKLNPQKRRVDQPNDTNHKAHKVPKNNHVENDVFEGSPGDGIKKLLEPNKKKQDSDKKRMEAMKKQRQEFRQKKNIIKTGLAEIDTVRNRKIKFSDNEEDTSPQKKHLDTHAKKTKIVDKSNTLFDDEDSGDDVNFKIKKQFEGKKGQKVLDLQSRYKSDKRFVLDERFVDGDQSDEEKEEEDGIDGATVDVGRIDEKDKQLDILQDVLGVSIRRKPDPAHNPQKIKSRPGMLRFDPAQPEHAKFLAPIEAKQELSKKSKKKKTKQNQEEDVQLETLAQETPKIEVSKEQFYKVSETLKQTIAQPTKFSLRSLFTRNEDEDDKKDVTAASDGYIPLESSKGSKIKNPLDPSERNPFVYDSSDSETEEKDEGPSRATDNIEVKAVWRENFFFTESDHRLKDGLAFFNKVNENEGQKERRELKSLMKKRIYNKERKNQMFQKKIGGKKKSMTKRFKRKH